MPTYAEAGSKQARHMHRLKLHPSKSAMEKIAGLLAVFV